MPKGVGWLEWMEFHAHNGNTCAVEVVNGTARGMRCFAHGRLARAQAR